MLDSLAFVLQTGAAKFAIDLPNALYVISKVSFCCPQLVPANAFKTLFLLLSLLGTCTQCLLNEKKVPRYTHSNLGLRNSGSSESDILIFGRVLACAGSGVNKVTDDFSADIKSTFSRRNQDISVK